MLFAFHLYFDNLEYESQVISISINLHFGLCKSKSQIKKVYFSLMFRLVM